VSRPREPLPRTSAESGVHSNDEREAYASSSAFSVMEMGSMRKPSGAWWSGIGTRSSAGEVKYSAM
jgi:hypothetical protein